MTKPAKHILFVTGSSVAYVLSRGQFRALREAGYEVTFVSSPGPEHEHARAEGANVIAMPIRRAMSPLADLLSFWRLWRVMGRTLPDIAVVSTPKAGLLGGMAAWAAGVPVRVYMLRGLRLETASGANRSILRTTEKIACACADSVLCVSRSLRERAVAERITTSQKLVVLGEGSSNGVDLARFSPAQGSDSLRQELEVAANDFVIGFVGRLTRDKGIDELVQAFRQVSGIVPAKLVLVGDHDPEADDGLSRQTRAAIASDPNVRQVSWTDTARFYPAIDVLALPTYREGFPNVVLEAQASGVPVVTTEATGAVDSVVHGKTGYVVSVGSADRLAAALIELARDPEKRRAMGVAGRARVQSAFDQKQVWSNLQGYYETLRQGASRQGGVRLLIKWGCDRVFALILFVLLSPLLVLGAVAVLLTMGWPVLFRQPRIGRKGREIVIHKFRTMSQERDATGELLPDEKRATRAGRFLRALSLDELPQLWDVLCGHMSFVGPRPLLLKYRERYSPEQYRRHNVYPGITGWAQVNGRNTVSWEEKFKLDVWYVDHWSLWLDAKILMRTVARVIKREGISQAGFEGAQEFLGSDRTR